MSTNTLNVETNGFRNVILRATQVSDGTDGEKVTIYNATSTGAFGVNIAGAIYYPGVRTTVTQIKYDVQDAKINLLWEATTDTSIMPLGSAPEDFNFTDFGGIQVPAGLAGATGSIKIQTIQPTVGATYAVIIYLRKNVP